MKARIGFVSNSSSSSFIIRKDTVTDKQRKILSDPEELYEFLEKLYNKDKLDVGRYGFYEHIREWDVDENEDFWEFSTFMDNFDLKNALEDFLGVEIENYEKD